MTEAGYVTNYPDGTFRPDRFITRAEAVTLFNKVFGRQPDKEYIDKHVTRTYPDLSKNHWAYYEIIEAAETHEYGYTTENDANKTADTNGREEHADGGKNNNAATQEELWVRKAGK